jgi:hypothetical protein
MNIEAGVVVIGSQWASLIAAVESEDAEIVFKIVEPIEQFGAKIGGVEPTPHSVVIKTRVAHTDIVAHDIGVGAGIPAEAYLSESSVDATKAQRARAGGHIILIEKTHGGRSVGDGGCSK